jgi:hypothetical protein
MKKCASKEYGHDLDSTCSLTTETDGKATNLRVPDEAEDLLITCSTVHLEELDVDGKILLKWIFKNGGGMEWFAVVHDRDRWRALVYAVMSLRAP